MDTDLLLTAEDMTTNEIRDLINALKALLEEKEVEDIEVKIGDQVEFEIKKRCYCFRNCDCSYS